MDQLHPRLEHGLSITDLNHAVADLSAAIPSLTDDELMVGVMRIVASVSADGCDGHLGAFVWGTGSYPVDSLPLRLWLFDEGLFIVAALPPHQKLVGARIAAMGGRSIEEVLAAFDPLIPRDNEQTVRLLLPRFLLMPQVHHGLGLATSADEPITLELAGDDGANREVSVDAIPMAEYNAWAGGYGLHLPTDPGVLYLSRIDEDLWWETLDDGTLFVQYNRVEFLPTSELDGLFAAMSDNATERVVIDIRHNFGGEVRAIDPFVEGLRDPAIGDEGRLFLITGRNTNSAGSLFTARLLEYTDAIIVGETGGGCPTFWGDIEPVSLPYSGIEISVPTLPEIGISPTDPRRVMEPDLPVPLTVADWMTGIDRALTEIQESAN